MDRHQQLGILLQELEDLLRDARLWSSTAPDAEALASLEPFACDRLLFSEWLQFIFIPRLRQMIAGRHVLPEACEVAPMADVFFSQMSGSKPIICVIKAIDALISPH